MKFIFPLLLTVGCASSVNRVSDKTYKAKCDFLFGGSCKEEISRVCPNGHKVHSEDTEHPLFRPVQDVVYFECQDKRTPAKK